MRRMCQIKQMSETELNLYVYSEICNGYTVDYSTWEFEKNEASAEYLREKLEENPNATQINIYINSPGGEAFEGTAIYNILKRNKAHKTVYVDGIAASAASVVAMAGDEIIMPKNTLMMLHNPWVLCSGNARDLRKIADDLTKVGEASKNAYLEKAKDKLTHEELTEIMDNETWLTAEECYDLGLCDKLVEENNTEVQEVLDKELLNAKQKLERLKNLNSVNKDINELLNKGEKKEPEQKIETHVEDHSIFKYFNSERK